VRESLLLAALFVISTSMLKNGPREAHLSTGTALNLLRQRMIPALTGLYTAYPEPLLLFNE